MTGGRIVRLAETSVTLHLNPACGAERVADLLFDGAPDQAAAPLNVTLRLGRMSSGRWSLRSDESPLPESDSLGHLAQILMDQIALTLTSSCRHGMLFHAAAACCAGRVVLMPGGSGSGKSTAAASLVRRGLTLLGDEIAHIGDDHAVRSYPRPFAFKASGLPVVRRWLDFGNAGGQTLETPLATLVPARLLGHCDATAACPLGAIVFPAREAGRAFACEPLSRAATALGLMASLVNAHNLTGHGFAEVVAVARAAPGYRLHYSDVEDIAIERFVTW